MEFRSWLPKQPKDQNKVFNLGNICTQDFLIKTEMFCIYMYYEQRPYRVCE